MKIKIQNFGKIKSADISIKGLSVIVGKNDSGKSTIGKCLYALKKSISEYKSLFNSYFIKYYTETITFDLRPRLMFSPESKQILNNSIDYCFKKDYDGCVRSFQAIKEFVNRINDSDFQDKNNDIEFLKKKIIEIEQMIENTKKNNTSTLEYVMNKIVFPNVFKGKILNNSLYMTDVANINFSYQNKDIISLKIENNEINIDENHSNEELYEAGMNKVIFLDTPLLLDENSLSNSNIYRNDIKQLIKENGQISLTNKDELLQKFKDIIKGEFVTDQIGNYFYKTYRKAESLEIENIAMGVKIIGILYLLLKNGGISPTSLIILDEPENHLHPNWLIKLADILCYMISEGFKIILTTHNADFVQLLNYYSKQYHLDNVTKFYLCEEVSKIDNYININDKTDRIEEIFENLTNDINKIFFSIFKNNDKNE